MYLVPNLHGNVGDGSNAALTMLRTPSGIETAEELAKREDKLAKDMREQVDLLLSKEEQAKRLQLPHVLVIYLINPFGQIASIEQQTNDQNISELFTDFSERFETLANAARSQVQLELLPLRKIYDYCTVMGLGGSEQQWDAGWRTSSLDELRRMAFSIYTQPRLLHSTIAQDALSKSMTKFGTAERMKELFLTFGDNMFLLKQNCSPFLLAPERSINFLSNISSNNSSSGSTGISGNIGGISSGQHFLTSSGHKLQLLNSDERILFLAYCLIADGKWLCASVTDERGSLLDTALINLNVPSEDSLPPLEPQKEWRHRERHSQISDALQRLWLFIRSIMLGQEVHHWRLIINRMGKLGHGEFKIWNDLLSKRSLRAYNSSLKNNQSNVDGLPTSASTAFLNNCQACSNSYGWHETPALLSACLVSIEAEPHLRVFGSPSTSFNSLDNQSTGNGGSSNINSTSSNVISSSSNLGSSMNTKSGSSKGTSRHSLLQAQQWAAVQQQLQSSPDDRSLTHIIVFPTILNVSCQQQEDMHGGIDDDVFADFLGNCFSGDGAPDGMELVEDLVFDESARNEEEAPIDNQPMAIGYTITTAPVWPSTSFCRSDISLGSSLSSDCGLSDAFWYNCPPAARYRRLAHLKSSLHINTTNLLQTDDYQQTTGRGNTGAVSNTTAGNTTALTEQLAPNPLDLPNTDDVLRYVLERQNALSWLNLDPVSGSRFSCLPIHMQTIYRLAESFGTIFDFS